MKMIFRFLDFVPYLIQILQDLDSVLLDIRYITKSISILIFDSLLQIQICHALPHSKSRIKNMYPGIRLSNTEVPSDTI